VENPSTPLVPQKPRKTYRHESRAIDVATLLVPHLVPILIMRFRSLYFENKKVAQETRIEKVNS